VAGDPRYFTYLRDAPGSTDIVLGDARLSLQDAPDATYGLIVADAFSSDAIPTHLITREALALYFRKLTPSGALAFHVSNRYLDLKPVLGNLAREAGLTCLVGDQDVTLAEPVPQANSSVWVTLTRERENLGEIARSGLWRPCRTGPDSNTWTDDYSNILSVIE
jgi:spermidine synthase